MAETNETKTSDPDLKGPLQSKKFVAFLVAEVTWKVALLVLLILGMKEAKIDLIVGTIAMAIVIIAGAVEMVYISGQAALDKYIRIASIAVGAGQNFTMKGLSSDHRTDEPMDSPVAETGTDKTED